MNHSWNRTQNHPRDHSSYPPSSMIFRSIIRISTLNLAWISRRSLSVSALGLAKKALNRLFDSSMSQFLMTSFSMVVRMKGEPMAPPSWRIVVLLLRKPNGHTFVVNRLGQKFSANLRRVEVGFSRLWREAQSLDYLQLGGATFARLDDAGGH